MASYILDTFVGVVDEAKVAGPSATLSKTLSSRSDPEDDIRLYDTIGGLPPMDLATASPGVVTPNETERSRPGSPSQAASVSMVPGFSNPPMNRFRVVSACVACFGNGLNDSAPGALIPYMEKDYKIGYAIVSLIFISNALGYISAAFITDALHGRLGRAKTLIISEAIMATGYVALVCTPPFIVVVLAFFLLGLGMATNLALNNVFVANLANSMTLLGAFHGSYGLGGTIGPLIATAMVSHGFIWSRFYLLSLGVAIFNVLFAGWTFWGYEWETAERGGNGMERTASGRSGEEPSKMQLLKKALRNKVTVLGALFIFAYQGAEVSISGWVISFLINYRNGNPAQVGYVTAGFWGGITAGRFVLSQPAHRIGERTFVGVVVVLAAAVQLLVWLVPNIIGNAIAVAIVGLLLGPIYPCATAVLSRLLGRRVQMSALSFIAATGSSGGALAPFFTGLGAQAVGTWILHPVCIGLYVVMQLTWCLLPRSGKRIE